MTYSLSSTSCLLKLPSFIWRTAQDIFGPPSFSKYLIIGTRVNVAVPFVNAFSDQISWRVTLYEITWFLSIRIGLTFQIPVILELHRTTGLNIKSLVWAFSFGSCLGGKRICGFNFFSTIQESSRVIADSYPAIKSRDLVPFHGLWLKNEALDDATQTIAKTLITVEATVKA